MANPCVDYWPCMDWAQLCVRQCLVCSSVSKDDTAPPEARQLVGNRSKAQESEFLILAVLGFPGPLSPFLWPSKPGLWDVQTYQPLGQSCWISEGQPLARVRRWPLLVWTLVGKVRLTGHRTLHFAFYKAIPLWTACERCFQKYLYT